MWERLVTFNNIPIDGLLHEMCPAIYGPELNPSRNKGVNISMRKNINLLQGPILPSLARLAMPIMGTSLMQMAYNLTDMIWIGRISSNAVAAVGAAGMYLWLSNGFATLARLGGQVLAGQSLGADKRERAVAYARAALQMGAVFGLVYGLLAILLNGPLIGFFHLNSPRVVQDARIYLVITCGGVIVTFLNQIITGLLTAMGNSAVTFRATSIGLLINVILDPVLIFGPGPLPRLGVAGAAIATVLAQVIVFVVYFITVRKDPVLFAGLKPFKRTPLSIYREIVSLGFPAAVQGLIFTGISMIIARLIAGWGDAAVAVQKVGSQIESISWMTAEGFGSAVNAFTAQNHGAGQKKRVKQGYFSALAVMAAWGIFTSLVLIVFPEGLFRIFIQESEVIPMGVDYLRILGFSQLFMCTEAASSGTFQGLGRTVPPSVIGIVFTALRIPAAIFLASTALALNGIWWSITISSILKGIILPLWLMLIICKRQKAHEIV